LKDTELNPVIQKFMDDLRAEITQKCDAVISEFEQRTRELENEVRNDLMELQSRIYQIEPMTQKNRDVIKYILEKIKDIRDKYQYDYELNNGY
jgi:chromosome condensin MukBEF complex kleisin-like MukF subunit